MNVKSTQSLITGVLKGNSTDFSKLPHNSTITQRVFTLKWFFLGSLPFDFFAVCDMSQVYKAKIAVLVVTTLLLKLESLWVMSA